MARLIDADEFERFLMNLPDEVLCEGCCYVIVNEMRKQPTIEAEPVMHGKWFDVGSLSCRCNRCGCKNSHETDYCPNCGARMDGEKSSRD